ncbi:MAG: hypothetical protein ACI4RN_08955 [Oscillospiraceae bacterium]
MMQTYDICGLKVNVDFRYPTLIERGKQYLTDYTDDADLTIPFDKDAFEDFKDRSPYCTYDSIENMLTTQRFYSNMVTHSFGFMLHSSAVVVDNKAYLFTANSGTGKSTHTRQWLKLFGDRAYILNDDKPALIFKDDKVYACGTPWSGSSPLSRNTSVPLQGICCLERSENNFIVPLDNRTAIFKIMKQTFRPYKKESMDIFLTMLDRALSITKVWRMGCNISTEAAQMAYDAMSK